MGELAPDPDGVSDPGPVYGSQGRQDADEAARGPLRREAGKLPVYYQFLAYSVQDGKYTMSLCPVEFVFFVYPNHCLQLYFFK